MTPAAATAVPGRPRPRPASCPRPASRSPSFSSAWSPSAPRSSPSPPGSWCTPPLWLVVALGGLAVEYLLLTAEFIAWVQVLIYVGSVVVLLLFGLMLTKAPIGRSPDADSGNRWAALTVAVAAAVALVWVVVDAFRTTWIDLDGPAAGTTEVTGASLFRHWVLPFEALSVLLLAALVGAIVLSRKAKADAAAPAAPGKEGAR